MTFCCLYNAVRLTLMLKFCCVVLHSLHCLFLKGPFQSYFIHNMVPQVTFYKRMKFQYNFLLFLHM